jgi:hypothetical protein
LHKANDDFHSNANVDDKDNDVAGWVASIPFDRAAWDIEFSADIDVGSAQRFVFAVICDPAIRLTISHAYVITPVSVGLTAAGDLRIVRSHQGAKPLACDWIGVFPLTVILGVG